MPIRLIPSRQAIVVVGIGAAATLAALVAGVPIATLGRVVGGAAAALAAIAVWDAVGTRHAWHQSPPTLTRRLPAALAIGVRRPIALSVINTGRYAWQCALFDRTDPRLQVEGLPIAIAVNAAAQVDATYLATPTERGEVVFAPADVRVRSQLGLWELLERLGPTETRRVYPDFAQVARYAWLAGDRRLQEIGIKTFQQRGQGTDFKQLAEYRTGDAVRHIDWRATLRIGKPIVRQFQDERDQCVMLLVDCGRRMRASDRGVGIGTSHFDQVLNAVVLLAYVALKQGDAVGAMTFGAPPEDARSFAPRKGTQALNALMAQLSDVQPTPTHSDYVAAAQALLARQPKRALVVVITNFRDEDSPELAHALRLIRSKHLLLLASLRERVVGEMLAQPLVDGDAAIDVASAHVYEQARRDAFARLAARDAGMVDAPPERLGVELVNRYHAMKRAGLL